MFNLTKSSIFIAIIVAFYSNSNQINALKANMEDPRYIRHLLNKLNNRDLHELLFTSEKTINGEKADSDSDELAKRDSSEVLKGFEKNEIIDAIQQSDKSDARKEELINKIENPGLKQLFGATKPSSDVQNDIRSSLIQREKRLKNEKIQQEELSENPTEDLENNGLDTLQGADETLPQQRR